MALTLGELLDQPGFGLELRAGGEAARERTVEGVHCLELLDPVPWLKEGWLMLTAGAQLRDDANAQRLLVERVATGNIAALGFGVGAFMPELPSALLQEAERRRFPVFTSPYETPFREIVTYVNQSILSHDLYLLRRLTWMQQYLSDALREPDAEQLLLQRLSGLMGDAAVAYLDALGRPHASVGPPPPWAQVAAAGDPRVPRETELDGRWALIAPVSDRSALDGWLVVTARAQPPDRQLAKSLLQAAVNLLALLVSTRRTAARSRVEQRRRVAMTALRVARGERDPGLAGALAAEGIDFTRPCRMALAAERGRARNGERGGGAPLAALDAFVRAQGIDAVATAWEGRAALIAQDDLTALASWLGEQRGPSLAIGVSEPFRQAEQIATALDQAELALSAAELPGLPRDAVRRHEELDPEILVIGEVRSPAVLDKLIATLGPLADQPPLLEAVQAYFDRDFDVGGAADALHLHRNSLRNRLRRAEELLGRPLKSSTTIASLRLAMIASRLRRPSHAAIHEQD